MYTYTISNDDTQKITEKTKNYSDLLEKFKSVDDKFTYKKDEVQLDKKTFSRPSDEDIEKSAKNSLEEYKNSEINGIENTYKTKAENIDAKIEDANTNGDKQKTQMQSTYASLKQNAKDDAIKRGLSRSSIVINILDAFDKNMIEDLKKINDDIQSKVQNLNEQKAILNAERTSALNAFDISYALKLSNKIDEINQDLLKQEEKVLEYNNQIAQKEADYKAKSDKDALDYATFIQKNGTQALDELKRGEKYEYAKEYLNSLSKEDALQELNYNNTFTEELGASYYNKLKVLTKSRKI